MYYNIHIHNVVENNNWYIYLCCLSFLFSLTIYCVMHGHVASIVVHVHVYMLLCRIIIIPVG